MVGCVGTHLRMEMPGQIRGLFGDQVAAMGPRIDDGVQDLIKSRHASARCGRPIRAAIKGLQVRREKHGEWPTPSHRHRLDRLHVNVIEIGAFLAIHFDADEMAVQQSASAGFSKLSCSITWHQWQAA